MSKAYTADDYSDQVASDLTWRIREISDLKSAVDRADSILAPVLLRSAVCICYAHWEGHTRFSSRKFLEHVAIRKSFYKDLDPQFVRNHFIPRLGALTRSKLDLVNQCQIIDDILGSKNKQYTYLNDDLINTGGNLNSERLKNICIICGIDPNIFSEHEIFIDKLLLKRRNSIAHGEDTFFKIKDFPDLVANVVTLMRSFSTELDNKVQLKQYLSN